MELQFPSPEQDLCYRWLDKAAHDRRYTPFALACAGFGDLDSSHRRWTVAPVQPWCLFYRFSSLQKPFLIILSCRS